MPLSMIGHYLQEAILRHLYAFEKVEHVLSVVHFL
jgi:hypothetical protein